MPRVLIRLNSPKYRVRGMVLVWVDISQHSILWAPPVVAAELVLPHPAKLGTLVCPTLRLQVFGIGVFLGKTKPMVSCAKSNQWSTTIQIFLESASC